jgi:O-antigen/teichoic acid export membrane protein
VVFGIISLGVILLLNLSSGLISTFVHSPELVELLKITAFYIVLFSFLIISQMLLLSFLAARFLFWANSILKSGTVIVAYFIIKQGGDLQQVILGIIGINAIIAGFYFIRLFKFLRPKPATLKIWPFYKLGLVAWVTQFVNYLLGRYFDIFLLGYFAVSKQEIGYYNIAFSITMAMHYFFSSGFGGIITASFSKFEQENRPARISEGWQLVTRVCIFFTLPVFVFVIFNADQIIRMIYSVAYQPSAFLLKVFACFYLISVILGSGANSSILYAIRKENMVLYLRIGWGLVNVVLDLLLIPRWGTLGAIGATGFATVGIIGMEYLFANKYVGLKFPFLFLIKIVGAGVLGIGISQLISYSSILELIINGFVFFLVFVLFIFLLKPFTFSDLRSINEIHQPFGKIVNYFVK